MSLNKNIEVLRNWVAPDYKQVYEILLNGPIAKTQEKIIALAGKIELTDRESKTREAAVERREEEVESSRKALEEQKTKMETDRTNLETAKQDFWRREGQMDERVRAAETSIREAEQHKRGLAQREQAIERREQMFTARANHLKNLEQSISGLNEQIKGFNDAAVASSQPIPASTGTSQQAQGQGPSPKRTLTDPHGPGDDPQRPLHPTTRGTSSRVPLVVGLEEDEDEAEDDIADKLNEVSRTLIPHMELPGDWEPADTKILQAYIVKMQDHKSNAKRPLDALDWCAEHAADGKGTCWYQRTLFRRGTFDQQDTVCDGCGKSTMGLCLHISFVQGQEDTVYNPNDPQKRWIVYKRKEPAEA